MSGFDSQGNRIRYGMPEIYDERKDPNAWRRAGQPAQPMRNAVRWDEAVDEPWVSGVVEGFGARPESLVAIFAAVQERYGYLPERALRIISDRMTHPLGAGLRRRRAGRLPAAPGRGPRHHRLHLRRLPLRRWRRPAGRAARRAGHRSRRGDRRRPLHAGDEPGGGRRRHGTGAAHRHAGVRAIERGPGPAPGPGATADGGRDRMTVDAGGTGLSPQIRILPRGEQRLLANVGRVDPNSLASLSRARRLCRPGAGGGAPGPRGRHRRDRRRRPARARWRRLADRRQVARRPGRGRLAQGRGRQPDGRRSHRPGRPGAGRGQSAPRPGRRAAGRLRDRRVRADPGGPPRLDAGDRPPASRDRGG